MYDDTTHGRLCSTKAVIAGHATVGPQTLVFRYFAVNGGGGNRPFRTYNPNQSDDGRLAQTQSVHTVWEIDGADLR